MTQLVNLKERIFKELFQPKQLDKSILEILLEPQNSFLAFLNIFYESFSFTFVLKLEYGAAKRQN